MSLYFIEWAPESRPFYCLDPKLRSVTPRLRCKDWWYEIDDDRSFLGGCTRSEVSVVSVHVRKNTKLRETERKAIVCPF